MRDIFKAVEEGNKIRRERPALDIALIEVVNIREKVEEGNDSDAILDAIIDAYSAGLAIGIRNGKAEK